MLGYLSNETLKYLNVGQTSVTVKLNCIKMQEKSIKRQKLRFWGREKEMMETKKKLEAIVPFVFFFDRNLSLFFLQAVWSKNTNCNS